jgi:hypothetical protein
MVGRYVIRGSIDLLDKATDSTVPGASFVWLAVGSISKHMSNSADSSVGAHRGRKSHCATKPCYCSCGSMYGLSKEQKT